MTEHRCKSLRNNASQCPRRLRREMHNRARDLQAEFPGRNGFSAPNLWLMRQFFNEYRDKPNLQSPIREMSWSKNLLIMARCKDDLEREFYLRATARICRSKTKTMVEYALRTASHALGIATYTVTPQLPASYQADLPSPEQIAARLQGWTGRDGLALDVNDGDLDEVEP
jgi:predicted nuclease of restriction endonuclease-like (RecB) superfamily